MRILLAILLISGTWSCTTTEPVQVTPPVSPPVEKVKKIYRLMEVRTDSSKIYTPF